MPTVIRVAWTDPRAVALNERMDVEMTERYAGRHDDDIEFDEKAAVAFAIDPADIVTTLLAIDDDGSAVGHAAIRSLGDRYEVKRVVVDPVVRGRGVGMALMVAADAAGRDLGAGSLILQTGDRQPEAVALYEKLGYRRIPIYDPYLPITNSFCFEKRLD